MKSACRAKKDVGKTPMALSDEFSESAKRKVSMVERGSMNVLKRTSTHVEIKSKGAVSRIWAELERDDKESAAFGGSLS